MISNVCQVSKTSNHAKDLRKSSDDIRHYLVKTNNRVLTEVPNGSSCANFIAILCLSHHFQASILSQLALITLKKKVARTVTSLALGCGAHRRPG